jgi:hypothetical protein
MPIPTALDSLTGLAIAATATIVSDLSGARALKLALAGRWVLTIHCTHASRGLSVVRYRRRVSTSAPWGPWITATGVTVAALATAEIGVDGDCLEDLDVELTGDGGASTAALYVAGV